MIMRSSDVALADPIFSVGADGACLLVRRALAGRLDLCPARNKELRMSSYLAPWDQLDECTQKIDFDLVQEILASIAEVGQGKAGNMKRARML
jgi:hypothetical protein